MNIHYRLLLTAFSIFIAFTLFGKEAPPPSNTLVTDYIGLLSPQEQAALERKLVVYDDSTSTQIAVVIEESLEGDDLFDYTIRLVEKWGIGREGKDNGILLYVAFQDRKVIIQTGYGAEGFLPDAIAKRIIENVIKPAFRSERYYAGLDRSTDIIMGLGSGEYTNEGGRRESEGIPALAIIIILLVIVIVFFSLASDDDDDGGYWGGGRYDMDPRRGKRRGGGWIFLPGGGGGFGGSGGGGFGGGGFGGFGGGGFGGGGASGSW